MSAIKVSVVLAGAVAVSGTARAEEDRGEAIGVVASASPTTRAAEDGAFLSMTLAPRTGTTAAFAVASAGYDGAARSPRFDSVAEVRLWGPADLRGGASYSASGERMRPNVGLRVQLLRQETHGLDGSAGVFYKAEGFTEPEGEIEAVLSAGARFGALSVAGNLAYGQDPEGNERDGEARAAIFRRWRLFTVGLDARGRFALADPRSTAAQREPRVDLAALPFASVVAGPVALFAQAGVSALQLANADLTVGMTALGGVGAAF